MTTAALRLPNSTSASNEAKVFAAEGDKPDLAVSQTLDSSSQQVDDLEGLRRLPMDHQVDGKFSILL